MPMSDVPQAPGPVYNPAAEQYWRNTLAQGVGTPQDGSLSRALADLGTRLFAGWQAGRQGRAAAAEDEQRTVGLADALSARMGRNVSPDDVSLYRDTPGLLQNDLADTRRRREAALMATLQARQEQAAATKRERELSDYGAAISGVTGQPVPPEMLAGLFDNPTAEKAYLDSLQPDQDERRIERDVNRVPRFVDTGEQVFEGVVPAAGAGRPRRILNDSDGVPRFVDTGERVYEPRAGSGGPTSKLSQRDSQNVGARDRVGNSLRALAERTSDGRTRFEILADPGQTAQSKIPLLGNLASSEDFQIAKSAAAEMVDALIREVSGAATPDQEVVRYFNSLLPRAFDTPQTVRFKWDQLLNRYNSIEGRIPADRRMTGMVPESLGVQGDGRRGALAKVGAGLVEGAGRITEAATPDPGAVSPELLPATGREVLMRGPDGSEWPVPEHLIPAALNAGAVVVGGA